MNNLESISRFSLRNPSRDHPGRISCKVGAVYVGESQWLSFPVLTFQPYQNSTIFANSLIP